MTGVRRKGARRAAALIVGVLLVPCTGASRSAPGTALWLQHGWLADDGWLSRNHRCAATFRSPDALARLGERLRAAGVTEVFPHLGPTSPDGPVSPRDAAQTERLLDALPGVRVVPWLAGGVGSRAFPGNPAWRRAFAASVRGLLESHPRLAGVQVDLEPVASGDPGFLATLDEVRQALPPGRTLSVAVPPARLDGVPAAATHWEAPYWRAVAARADQVAVMLYDTGLAQRSAYEDFVQRAGRAAVESAAEVLFGLPAYVHGVAGRHDPAVESLAAGLSAVEALLRSGSGNSVGIAVFCEWEMSEGDWRLLRHRKSGR